MVEHQPVYAVRSGSLPSSVPAPPTARPLHHVGIATIHGSYSARKNLANRSHVAAMAQSPQALPPILIHSSTMRVIDGVHRLAVAQRLGQRFIAAYFFDGSEADAFALAVHLNVAHGLPLSLEEKRNAAQQLLRLTPEISDRAVGLITGLSNKTVARVRQRSPHTNLAEGCRLGRDGKLRPVNPTLGRERAAAVITTSPEMSLREVAQIAGVSVSTVRSVRRRLAAATPAPPTPTEAADAGIPFRPAPHDDATSQAGRHDGDDALTSQADEYSMQVLLHRMRNDPAIRSSEKGRAFLRLAFAAALAVEACHEFATIMPPHCAKTAAELAGRHASAWHQVETVFACGANRE